MIRSLLLSFVTACLPIMVQAFTVTERATLERIDETLLSSGITCNGYSLALRDARAEVGLFVSRTRPDELAFGVRVITSYMAFDPPASELVTSIEQAATQLAPVAEQVSALMLDGVPLEDSRFDISLPAVSACLTMYEALDQRTKFLMENDLTLDN